MDRKILIVDDEPEVTGYLKTYFELQGVAVSTAATGEDALEILASECPSLVLLDIRLGKGLSGIEVIRRAKQMKWSAEIIVLSALEDRNIMDLAKGLGASAYITKPIIIAELERVVLSRLKP